MEKNSFVMYTEYLKHIQKMDMGQRGELFTAILCYAAGEPVPDLDPAADMAFSFIQDRMDRDNEAYMEKCKKRREAGKLGGMAKADALSEKQNVANASFAKQNVANGSKTKQNTPDNDNEHDNDTDNKNIMCEANALFERLWKMYPSKKGKGQVSDTQKKRLLAIGESTLVKAIERYSLELQKDADWRKPQNGSTFFNSGYVDYLDENYSPGEEKKPKKNSFQNFEQREYDFDELERSLQG